MARERVCKGDQVVRIWKKTLMNEKISLKYRLMIFKNIIISTIVYGSEKFECNESRVRKLKDAIDVAIKCRLKKNNFVRERAYKKLGIK